MIKHNTGIINYFHQVVPFITQHITNRDWRYKDAAVMAFGSILEGPTVMSLRTIVDQGLPTLIGLLQDPSVVVRDTTAWAIGRYEFALF